MVLQTNKRPEPTVSCAYQPALRPVLPHVIGSLDYRIERDLFVRIDAILAEASLDADFFAMAIADQKINLATRKPSFRFRFAKLSFVALRAIIARDLTQLGHREFVSRLADSALLQWFLHVGEVDQVRVFSKSTSQRFTSWLNPESLVLLNQKLVQLCIKQQPQDECAKQGEPPSTLSLIPFDLEKPIVCDEVFFDTTCVETTMHFPVDWILLRDAVRTLSKGITLIRKAGLKHRMSQTPEAIMREMNKLCIQMSAQRRTAKSKQARKAVLRLMKKLVDRVAHHARTHLKKLAAFWHESTLSEGGAAVIRRRLEGVLTQLPAAKKQAHERIIGERPVANKDKILSLYDDKLQVIVRGKAGAEVEFGNKLSLAENGQGLIVDYKLHERNVPDTQLVEPCVIRLTEEAKLPVTKIWADRGMSSAANEAMLEGRGIKSGLCPRNPAELQRRLEVEDERAGMLRRSGTEARIGIFKNAILGGPLKEKTFEGRERAIGWAVLAHNLWVLARLPQRRKEKNMGTSGGVGAKRSPASPAAMGQAA